MVVVVEPAGYADVDCAADWDEDGDEEKINWWCSRAVSWWGREILRLRQSFVMYFRGRGFGMR